MDHSCKVCNKTVSSKHKLSMHMKTHAKLKCGLCEFAVGNQKTLEDHISAKHLGVKKFKCEECEYATSMIEEERSERKKSQPSNGARKK
jgi:hypothetical protein